MYLQMGWMCESWHKETVMSFWSETTSDASSQDAEEEGDCDSATCGQDTVRWDPQQRPQGDLRGQSLGIGSIRDPD